MGDKKKFYLGLDIGTDSVGWAVTDEHYHIVRKQGKHLWGSRLFSEAQKAEGRRAHRIARRRYVRRRQRILWLQEIFAKEMAKVDPNFFERLNNAAFVFEDKPKEVQDDYDNLKGRPLLFPWPQKDVDVTFSSDAAYHGKYPTIYHLRKDMMDHPHKKYDIRLIYLVMAHMIKYRGNFLQEGEIKEGGTDIRRLTDLLLRLENAVKDYSFDEEDDENTNDVGFSYSDTKKVEQWLLDMQNPNLRLGDLEDATMELLQIDKTHKKPINIVRLFNLIAGGNAKMKDIFAFDEEEAGDSELPDTPIQFDNEDFVDSIPQLGDAYAEVLMAAKDIYDFRVLVRTLQGENRLSNAMVKRYELHQQQLKTLKKLFRDYDAAHGTKCFAEFFEIASAKGKEPSKNYLNYVGVYKSKGNPIQHYPHSTKIDELYSALKKSAPIANDPENPIVKDILTSIDSRNYLLLQNSKDNGVLPYQLNLNEMRIILFNQSKYYAFLGEQAPEYNNPKRQDYRLVSLLEFKIPYYVGPLIVSRGENDPKGKNHWVVRKSDGKITPWNFHDVVDENASEEGFINNLKNNCTYLMNEPTLPKNSLRYTEFVALNQMNGWRIFCHGSKRPLTVDERRDLFNKVFLSKHKVTVARIQSELCLLLKAKPEDIVLCTDKKDSLDNADITLSLKPWVLMMDPRGFGPNLSSSKEDIDKAEEIIYCLTIFEDKKTAGRHIDEMPGLSDGQKKYFKSLSFKDWGRLSKKLIDGLTIPVPDQETGEVFDKTILDLMWDTGKTFMEIYRTKEPDPVTGLDTTGFQKQVEELTDAEAGTPYDLIEEQYASPSVKRSLRQSYRIIEELKKILHIDSFDAIFVEVTRSASTDQKGKRTKSRKDQILDFYKQVKKMNKSMSDEIDKLEKELGQKEDRLNDRRLFLYFAQLGHSVYTGKPIDIERLEKDYDIDHIIPRAKYEDDSFGNTVLVEQALNRNKSDVYPIEPTILTEGGRKWIQYLEQWSAANKIKFMSAEKARRLLRVEPLSEDELVGFVNRQIVATSQATTGIANLLRKTDPNSRVVFSKADRVSDFRKEFDMMKCREVNDFHHAQDAYLNIVVGDVYEQVFTKSFSVKQLREKKQELGKDYSIRTDVKTFFRRNQYRFGTKHGVCVWQAKEYASDGVENPSSVGTIDVVRKYMSHNDPLVTHMQATLVGKQGFFTKISIIGKNGSGKTAAMPLKMSGPFAKEGFEHIYGGYNDLTAPYFMLVRSLDKKGREIYTLEAIPAVYLANVSSKLNEDDKKKWLENYLTAKGGLKHPSIVLKELLPGTVFVRKTQNGYIRFTITGRTGNRFYCSNLVGLTLPKHWYDYFKMMSKYLGLELSPEKKKALNFGKDDEKEEIVISEGRIISKAENIKLFHYFGDDVLNRKPYTDLPASEAVKFDVQGEKGRNLFAALKIKQQCDVLEQLLIYFAFGSSPFDLSLVGGVKAEGMKLVNKRFDPSTDRIIAQSITGFHETQLWPSLNKGNN